MQGNKTIKSIGRKMIIAAKMIKKESVVNANKAGVNRTNNIAEHLLQLVFVVLKNVSPNQKSMYLKKH